MKKTNLIEWLWKTDSHEKQKVRGMRRYAAMLLMLLTLGVGQMWATVTIYAVGNMQKQGGDWVDEKTAMYCHNWGSDGTTWPGQSMTKWNDVSVDGHQVWTCNLKADGNTSCIFNNNGGWQTDNITNLNATVKAYPYPTYLNGTWYYSPRVCKCLWESNQTVSGGYIYFDNSSASWADTYVYLVVGHASYVGYYRIQQISNTKLWYASLSSLGWSDAKYVALVGNNSSKSTGSGNPNNLTSCNHYSDALGYGLNTGSTYLVSMTSGTNCTPISIDYKSDGYSAFNSTQTINTVVKAAGGSYTSANSKATISITSYEMTGDGAVTQRTPSISTSAKTATVSAARTATTTLSVGDVATGYQFDGWYTAATGGTQLSTSTTYTYYPTSATTVYARFSEKTFTVTVTNDGNGTTSPSGAQSNKGQITGVAVSATPSDGYNFNNWTITSGTGSFADATDASTTFYPTGTATIRANFVSAATSTMTVTATTGGSITTPAAGYYSDISEDEYDIEASRSEGYKFTGWTQSGDGEVSFGSASSLSTTATVTTVGDVTVTANFAAMSNSLSVSSSSVYAGSNVTLTATKTNHTLDLKYQYKIGSGSWNTITTKSGTSHTYTIPYANTYQTYYFRVVSTDGSTDIVSSNVAVNVKGRITIHVKNTNSWASMYLYSWYNDGSDHTTNGAWPGATGSGSNQQSCSIHATGSLWWDVTITQETATAQKFILNKNGSNNQDKTDDLTLSSFTHDAYYEMSTNGSAVQTLSTGTTPSKPTVTTSTAGTIRETSAVLGGNVTAVGNDNYTERGYYWSTNSALSSSNLGVGTKVVVSSTVSSSAGTYSGTKSGLSANTTYYFIAYAKNAYGTGYGSVQNFTTLPTYSITVAAGSGGTVSPSSVTAGQYQSSGTITATPGSNFAFVNWTASSNKITIASATSKSTTVTATATGTVTANFADKWNVKGNQWSSWGAYQGLPNVSSNTFRQSFTLPAKTTYQFKVVKRADAGGADVWYGVDGGKTLTRASNSVTGLEASGGETEYITFTTDAAGSYTITYVYNASVGSMSVTVGYPTAYTVTFGMGTHAGSSSAITASASPSFSSGDYVLPETDITFGKGSTKTGYTWKGWYSNNNGTGTLHSSTDANLSWTSTRTGNISVYACYDLVSYSISYTNMTGATNHGSNKASYTIEDLPVTLYTPSKTGYTFSAWKAKNSSGSSVTSIAVGSKLQDTTFYATWTPITYYVSYSANGGSGDAMDNQTFTYDVADNLTANTYTRTGYTFDGWATSAGGAKVYNNEAEVSNLSSTNGATYPLYAHWVANEYTITLDVDETHKGSFDGATGSVTATFDATMPTIGGTLPTAASGYRYMGMYTAADGGGVALTDSLNVWKENVDGYISGGKWIRDDDDVTLYAYYKQARITSLVLSPSTQAPGEEVTATPTISPTPDGTTIICWRLLRANGNEMPGVEFEKGEGNSVSFDAPEASGSYKVACILRTGGACNAGTRLDSVVADLTVAGEHTVTIRYQDSDGRTLAPSTTITGKPLEWSSDAIEPITITGYSFARWDAGDGISITDDGGSTTKTTTTTASIKVKATYEGTLTAVYNKKDILYFNNTLGWDTVYVYFYSTAAYWDNDKGTGANYDKKFTWDKDDNHKPHYRHFWGGMTKLGSSSVYYFDYEDSISNSSWNSEIRGYENVAFTNKPQGFGYGDDGEDADAIGDGYDFFYLTNVIRRGDYDHDLPMYVPLTGVEPVGMNEVDSKKTAFYYNEGYWMNYPENTGYTLKIYNNKTWGDGDPIQSIPFEFTADKTLPMQLTVELNANREYGFEIHRADGGAYGNNSKVMKNGDSGDSGTLWALTASQRTGLQTSVAGEYIFTLDFGNSSGYKYLIGVHYPVAESDYRIVYTDEVAWSQGSAHDEDWYHPSRTIEKKDGAKDIVSFYVSKATGANASMKFQYASAVDGEGVVTWSDVTEGTIGLTEIEESGVYNFYLSQADGAITVDSIRPYTGNYYIRTANAGSSGWDNYRAADHRLTYTDFSSSRTTNTFGDLYTHYYMHWCERNSDIRFVIANDYSSCISDTLVSDITDLGNLQSGANAGHLRTDFSADPVDDKFSANIRFMYNESTNKISRAYMSSSTNAARKFLVLRSNTKYSANGKALNGTGESNDDENSIYEAIFEDDQDWIYERTVKVKPGSPFKLYASYAQAEVSEDGSQHFRGAYADNDWSDEDNYVVLIGGSGDSCVVRVVYDFKTNRLMSAYVPSEEGDIDGTLAINADIMLVRDHQEAGQQLTFANGDAKLTDVKTVYGVMRFNRWILNNRQHPEDHDKEHSKPAYINTYHPLINVLGDLKSSSERGLYWISFPFDVRLSEVFGFGTYGTDWVFLGYNGADRAKEGYWIDSDSFWEYIWDRQDTVLKAGHGIVLALDLDRMGATNTSFWKNEIQQVELFFPSLSSTTGTIMQTNAEVTLDAYECTIDRRSQAEKDANVQDITKNRTVVDSHWNILGVPSYANYDGTLKHLYKDGEGVDRDSVIVWNDEPETDDLPFLYEWNANDNTYTVRSGNSYAFKAMHAYYVQFAGKIRWTLASATPVSPIVARRTYAERPQRVEFRLELQQNNKMVDHTYVKLRDDEEVSANFVFGEDLTKSLHQNKANIYTIVEDYLPVAGNTLPMSEQTMLIPVGVMPATEGEYTFSMPDGTEGIGVFLIDNVAHTRTNLGLTDYTVTLTAGKTNDRFMLEISPIAQTPTEIETVTGDGLQVTGARKIMIDGLLYIVKDGKVYDAQGHQVK